MSQDVTIMAGLDIGTTKICCVIAKQGAQGIEIIGMGQVPSPGVKLGQILNVEATAASIRKAVDQAQLMAGTQVSHVVVGIADRTVKSDNCTGMISLNHAEITEREISRVLASARLSLIVPDCELLHVIPREYRVDSLEEITNPLGMSCSRLEVRAHLVTAATTSVRNITKACQRAGLEVLSVVLQSIASADAVLTPDEKEMGVALVDIGGGTTDIAVFKHGALWYTAELTMAGSHITADIARHFRMHPTDAEQLKLQHGGCVAKHNEKITMGTRTLYREDLVNVITARIEELITEVATHTRRSRHGGRLVTGLVITGGTALISGLDLFLEKMTNVPVRIGVPEGYQGLTEMINHPACATGVGLVLNHGKNPMLASYTEPVPNIRLINRIIPWLKDMF